MKGDRVIWFGCLALFGAGAVWGAIHTKINFFEVANVHDFFEILAAVATVSAVILAVLNINDWKKQKRATASHDLARQVLVSVYEYREAIKSIRNPFIMAYELAQDPGDIPQSDPAIERFQSELRAYQRRLTRVEPIRAKLLAYSLEAQVVWGKEIKENFSVLFKLENEIGLYLQYYFLSKDPVAQADLRDSHRAIFKKMRNALSSDSFSGGDDFSQDMEQRFESIENVMREKMII